MQRVSIQNYAELQNYLGEFENDFVILHNEQKQAEMWNSNDPDWVGRASMSKNHVFLTVKDLDWRWFNTLTFGLSEENVPDHERAEHLSNDMCNTCEFWLVQHEFIQW